MSEKEKIKSGHKTRPLKAVILCLTIEIKLFKRTVSTLHYDGVGIHCAGKCIKKAAMNIFRFCLLFTICTYLKTFCKFVASS